MKLTRAIPLACAALITSWLPATAQETWNFASAYAATEFMSEGYELFAQRVEEESDGELQIVMHHGGSLFQNPEILQATRDGLVEMGTQLMTNLGRENALWELDGVPFFVSSYEEARKLWAVSREPLSDLLAESGLRLLFAAPWPTQGFYFNREVNSLDDVGGMSMRAYNPSTTRLAELMGATPTTVQITEVQQAFATGMVDSLNTSPTTAVVYSLWDYTDYYLKTDAWIPKQMVFVREESFQALSPEVQEAVLTAAAEAEEWLWERSEALVTEAEQTLVDNGMTLVVPEGQLAEELQAVGDTMLEEWMAGADDRARGVVDAMRD